MTHVNHLSVAMDSEGVLSRRGLFRSVGLGVAGVSGLSFTDFLAVQADELRKRQGVHPALDGRRSQPVRDVRPQARAEPRDRRGP